ncbi:cyclase family protein [Microbacterium atlanticum]|uniref:cyclase family protein n=1 Tax=Microbacterium atlanticum TaxID=2782168 RepID=UPI0018883594|nr:cyclase family protein [Microbacterium atlanticum]
MISTDTLKTARIIDLSMPVPDGMEVYPGEPVPRFRPISTHEADGFEMWELKLFSHLGTHVDAPAHFIRGGDTSEKLPLRSMIGPVVVLDVTVDSPGGVIAHEDIAAHDDRIRAAGRVILRTGWDGLVGTADYWEPWPQVSPATAAHLAELGITFLGLDTPGPSHTQMHEVHEVLLEAGCVIGESLVNLRELSEDSFLICLPVKVAGVDAAPARIVAIEAAAAPGGPAIAQPS